MPSLIAVLGGDMTQLKAVFDSAKDQAAKTGSSIKNSMAASLVVQSGGALKSSIANSLSRLNLTKPIIDLDPHGKAGVMREALVLMREIGNGNWSKVPGSFSILVSRLGILPKLLTPLFLIPVALGAVFAGAYFLLKKFSDSLVDLKLPDFNPEYIAKHLQKVNQVAETQKEINKELEKTIELYNSAAKAAERIEKTTKEDFEAKRKINQSKEQEALTDAGTDDFKKRKIREEFTKLSLELNAKEREAEIKNKRDAEKANKAEMLEKKRQADEFGRDIPSKAADDQNLKKRKADAEVAQKEMDKLKEEKEKDRIANEKEYGAGKTPQMHGFELYSTFEDRRNRRIADAKAVVDASNHMEDVAAANEEKRKKRDEMVKEAAQSGKKMIEAGQEGDELAKQKDRKDKEDADQAKAKLAAENAKEVRTRGKPDVNALQKIGGSYSFYEASTLDLAKKTEQHLREIKTKLGQNSQTNAPGTSATRY